MLFTKVPIPRRDTGDSVHAPQVTVTAPSRSNSRRSDAHRSVTLPLQPFLFRDTQDTQRQYYGTSSEDEPDTLRPQSTQPRKNSSESDIYTDARDLTPSGDDTDVSESSADFAEAVGSAATNTILGFDIDEKKRKTPSLVLPRRKESAGHFSPIRLDTTQALP